MAQSDQFDSHSSLQDNAQLAPCVVAGTDTEELDRILFAAWYDLSANEDEYLDWFHGEELPRLQSSFDFEWIGHYRSETAERHVIPEIVDITKRMTVRPEDAPDLGVGTQFMVLAAARDITALRRAPDLIPSQGTGHASEMRGLRTGHRRSVWAELLRVHGPAFQDWNQGAPIRIQHGQFNLHPGAEDNLWYWYRHTRYPQTLASPGNVMLRQLFGLKGWAQFGVIYEFRSKKEHMEFLDAFEKREGLLGENDPNYFQITETTIHAPGGPTIGSRIWPPVPAGKP